jgi:hypothetical protein
MGHPMISERMRHEDRVGNGTATSPNRPPDYRPAFEWQAQSFLPLRFSPPPIVPDNERRRLIREAAYFRAERRHFQVGHEVEDWLAAEAEVNRRIENVRRLAGNF